MLYSKPKSKLIQKTQQKKNNKKDYNQKKYQYISNNILMAFFGPILTRQLVEEI